MNKTKKNKKEQENSKIVFLLSILIYMIILFVLIPIKTFIWIALLMVIFLVANFYLSYSIMRKVSYTILIIGIFIFSLGLLVILKQGFIRNNKNIQREQIVEVNTFTIIVDHKEKALKPLFFRKQKGDWVNVLEIGSLKLVIEDSTFGKSLLKIGIYILLFSPSLICVLIGPINSKK